MALAIACAALMAAAPAFAAKPAPKAEAAAAASPAGRLVEYAELEHQLGAQIAVETTLNTVRRGWLIKYTGPALTLQLGPEAGSIELSVPRESVRSVRILAPAKTAQAE
ncbi:MAG: hypothetical protein GXC76_00130 [Rhodanobacteraceae bacterium]|jgi:hypothetical protein|nr:hypothetical protein [Rhodanobacteraceae bacterium]